MRTRVVSVVVVALAALGIAGAAACAASAAPLLELTSNGQVLPVGTPTFTYVMMSHEVPGHDVRCEAEYLGQVAKNGSARDVITDEQPYEPLHCPIDPEAFLSGGEGQVDFRTNGEVRLVAKPGLVLDDEGCVYQFRKAVGYNEIPSYAGAATSETVLGKLRKGSAAGCAQTYALSFEIKTYTYSPQGDEQIDTELYVPKHSG